MKKYLFDEQKGKVQGEMIIVEAENAVEAMEKAGMTAHIGPYETFATMYFGKIYGVKEFGAANYEYYCHR